MSDQTPVLSLPYIQGGQAQKHITHNEALERLDMLVQLTVEATGATTPPASATEGQAWIIGTGAAGAWASNTGDIAAWRGGGWLFVTPQTGWRVWDKSSATMAVYDGNTWSAIGTGGGGGGSVSFQNLPGVGVNAASDTTNRLAVSSPATLLNHAGAGHQLKVNKNASTDTASLLYQSNWSGRAEMGLAGNDDFSIKVSADGSGFTEALRIDAATGAVALPATGTRQILPYNYRYYLYTDKRWVSTTANSGTQTANRNLGSGSEPNIGWDTKGLFIPAGSVLNHFVLAGSFSNSQIADLDVRVQFQHGDWNGTWGNSNTTTRAALYSADTVGISGGNGMQRTTLPLNYTTPSDGYLIMALRPNAASTLTATRYFYCAAALDLTLPPA